jgi:hypothetical protein
VPEIDAGVPPKIYDGAGGRTTRALVRAVRDGHARRAPCSLASAASGSIGPGKAVRLQLLGRAL